VEFAYNASRTILIKHIPSEANFGFSLEKLHGMLFNVRPSISVSHNATERLQLLHEVHALLLSVLHPHKNGMQTRTEPSTTPHFVRGDKVTIFTKSLCFQVQLDRKRRDRQQGPFTIEDEIGKQRYIVIKNAFIYKNAGFNRLLSMGPPCFAMVCLI
jgi:hypothetical protein